MSTRLRHLWIWLRYLLAVLGILVFLAAWQRMAAVAAVQNAVDRDWEISFYSENNSPSGDTPPWLSPSIDLAVRDWIELHAPTSRTNRGPVYDERFRSLFRGPITDVHIYYPGTFRGDRLGAALVGFPNLQRFTMNDKSERTPESEWKALFHQLRSLPNLEEIELGGASLTDEDVAPLAGHPRLRSITITESLLTQQCAQTFAQLPRLRSLRIEGQFPAGSFWPTAKTRQAMRDALPNMEVNLSVDDQLPSPTEAGTEVDRSLAPAPQPP